MPYYRNPILPADYSDPDAIRVGSRYYMISSTIQAAPGMTILTSADLIHWETVGSVIPEPQLLHPYMGCDKMGAYNKGVYAGSLRFLEWREPGILRPRSKWFVYTTIFQAGIMVSTADAVSGPWETRFMLDKNGKELKAPFLSTEKGLSMTGEELDALGHDIPGIYWDDSCPYWTFNPDGTLKEAYMAASKPGGAWYPHVFRMSLDGTQLLDGELEAMLAPGDHTRLRDGAGRILHKKTGQPIPASIRIGRAEDTAYTPQGDISSVVDAEIIPGKEGCVIRDIVSGEALKLFQFGEGTQAGRLFFQGRHGDRERVAEYLYLFDSEVRPDGRRIPMLHRAKSIYGDRFDENGQYLGPGTAAGPGGFESIPIMESLASPADDRQPNQGAFIDLPPALAADGQEHWYFLTHHGDEKAGPEGRPVSLLPVTWINGWPIPGEIKGLGTDWIQGLAGVNSPIPIPPGRMMAHCPLPPVAGYHPALFPQGSDNFSGGAGLSPKWLWNHAPCPGAFSLTAREGWMRLYAFPTIDGSGDFFKTRNVLYQRYWGDNQILAEVALDVSGMSAGQEAGLAHFNGGISAFCLNLRREGDGSFSLGQNGAAEALLPKTIKEVRLLNRITHGVSQFYCQWDGGWVSIGSPQKLVSGGYRGDCIGLYTRCKREPGGYADFAGFRYEWGGDSAPAFP